MANEKLDLIDRKALLAEYDRVHIGPPGGARKLMEDAPTVQAVEVVHGEWFIDDRNKAERTCVVGCSVCGAILNLKMFDFGMNYNYCPNCGAKMDGGNEDGNL